MQIPFLPRLHINFTIWPACVWLSLTFEIWAHNSWSLCICVFNPPSLPVRVSLSYKLTVLNFAHVHYLLSSYQVSWGPEIWAWAPSDTFATYTHTTKNKNMHTDTNWHTQMHTDTKTQIDTHKHTQTHPNTPKSKTSLKHDPCLGNGIKYIIIFWWRFCKIYLYLTLANLSAYFLNLFINLLFLHPFVQRSCCCNFLYLPCFIYLCGLPPRANSQPFATLKAKNRDKNIKDKKGRKRDIYLCRLPPPKREINR